ncbi:MAG: hypothetical protein MJY71_02260 [Bacteroidaceae bacterium]|nr:hypothetical protein [Bacteroidaceae bacterium]
MVQNPSIWQKPCLHLLTLYFATFVHLFMLKQWKSHVVNMNQIGKNGVMNKGEIAWNNPDIYMGWIAKDYKKCELFMHLT